MTMALEITIFDTLSYGPATRGDLCHLLDEARTTIWDSLKVLMEKNLVDSYVNYVPGKKGRPLVYFKLQNSNDAKIGIKCRKSQEIRSQ